MQLLQEAQMVGTKCDKVNALLCLNWHQLTPCHGQKQRTESYFPLEQIKVTHKFKVGSLNSFARTTYFKLGISGAAVSCRSNGAMFEKQYIICKLSNKTFN